MCCIFPHHFNIRPSVVGILIYILMDFDTTPCGLFVVFSRMCVAWPCRAARDSCIRSAGRQTRFLDRGGSQGGTTVCRIVCSSG